MFDDPAVEIRSNAYKAMILVAEFTYGVDSIIQFNILPILIDKLIAEKNEQILILILTLLKILNEGESAPLVLQSTHALQRLNQHLKASHHKIRELSAMNIGSISYNTLGKEQTIETGSIPPLCEMLVD